MLYICSLFFLNVLSLFSLLFRAFVESEQIRAVLELHGQQERGTNACGYQIQQCRLCSTIIVINIAVLEYCTNEFSIAYLSGLDSVHDEHGGEETEHVGNERGLEVRLGEVDLATGTVCVVAQQECDQNTYKVEY